MTQWPDHVLARSSLTQQAVAAAASQLRVGSAVDGPLAAEAEQLSSNLLAFQRAAWHVVEPSTEYQHNWHIEAICDHLEAVSRGEILRLVINIPPRTEKSLNVAVFWPAWVWTRLPSFRWLFSSYGNQLSLRDSVKCRRLITSPWYQSRWGHVYQLTTDQNVKHRFENDQTGLRLATSVGGVGTGEGGDAVVVDDPHQVQQAESTVKRTGVLEWWDETMSTRLNDPERGARVIVMQRVHEDDLTGHVLENDWGYEHLCLPMRWDPKVQVSTSLGWSDPRTEPDELMWPSRFPEPVVEQLERELGPYGTAGQLQQQPTARGGGIFARADFTPVDQVPRPGECRWVRYWDKAATHEGGAYTVGVLMAMNDVSHKCYVADVARGQWAADEREQHIDANAEADALRLQDFSVRCKQWVEQEPGSGGKDSALDTVRRLVAAGHGAAADPVGQSSGNKWQRADPLSGAVKAGLVHVVRAEWTEAYLREMENAGPGARYLDQMDASAGAYNKLTASRPASAISADLVSMTRRSGWRV